MRKNLGPMPIGITMRRISSAGPKHQGHRATLGGILRDSWPQSQIFTGSPNAVTGDTDEKLGVCSSPSAATVCSLW